MLTSAKPLWWLSLISLALFILSFRTQRRFAMPNWNDWHPVFVTLIRSDLAPNLWRWVRYKKITGGDCVLLLPFKRQIGLLLLDLSKNDLETFLHFVWARALLTYGWNRTKGQILKLLETVRQCSSRVDLSYLLGFISPNEAEWQSVGCFGIAWFNELIIGQQRVLPTLGRSFWKTRKIGVNWVFTTDGVAPYLLDVTNSLKQDGSPERVILSLPRQDDLTVGWFVPKLKALMERKGAFTECTGGLNFHA